jgi:GntR family transcriptional regulator, transcriptional repressor for pyruvate dehydrogenase complex
MKIEPIKRVNVSDQVFKQLKNMLIHGVWKQGEKLPSENELSEQFGVSRITVRQALQKLSVLGLIETRLGEGSFVRMIKPSDSMNALIPSVYLHEQSENFMYEIQEFREIVEIDSTRLAAEKASIEDIKELKVIYNSMKECQDDLKQFAKEDFNFHFKIGLITHNSLLIKTYRILREVLQISMTGIVEEMGCKDGLHYHSELIKAFENNDGAKASEIMREHVRRNKDYYTKKE